MKASNVKPGQGTHKLLKIQSDSNLAELVCQLLSRHHQFRYHLESLSIDCQNGCLVITGRLPSFYLKQLLQTVLLTMPDVKQIDNQVDVISSQGLSSVRLNGDRNGTP